MIENNYCVVKVEAGKFFVGDTKEEIVDQMFDYSVLRAADDAVILTAQPNFGRYTVKTQRFKGDEWTVEEAARESIKILYDSLHQYGFDKFEKRFSVIKNNG